MESSAGGLRAAVFDIGGVLFLEHTRGGFLTRWEEKLGIAPGTLLPILWEGGDIERANIGEITGEEYCRRAAARVGTDEANLLALAEDAFSGDYVNRPLASYIAALRPKLQVAALTNTWSFGRSLMERHGIASLFDFIVSSAEERMCKPDERIYRVTLERLGRHPGEVVFVDDVQENIDAATSIGIHGILYRSVEETTAAIDALLASTPASPRQSWSTPAVHAPSEEHRQTMDGDRTATIVVRDATEQEIDELAGIWHDSWQDAHALILPEDLKRRRTLQSFRDRMARLLPSVRVAGEPGAALGFSIVKEDELYQFYVRAEARGTGVAAALMADAEASFLRRGVATAWLACAIGNQRAARFYEKCGWDLVGNMVSNLDTPEGIFPLEVWRYERRMV